MSIFDQSTSPICKFHNLENLLMKHIFLLLYMLQNRFVTQFASNKCDELQSRHIRFKHVTSLRKHGSCSIFSFYLPVSLEYRFNRTASYRCVLKGLRSDSRSD